MELHPLGGGFWLLSAARPLLVDGIAPAAAPALRRAFRDQLASGIAANHRDLGGLDLCPFGDPAAAKALVLSGGLSAGLRLVSEGGRGRGMGYDGSLF